jgi:hypothetical protein
MSDDDDDNDDDDLLDPNRRYRRGDPSTSREAAIQSVSASRKSVDFAEQVMSDGIPRIDEEIWLECRSRGFLGSLDALEHGRRVLEITGVLAETGVKRRTSVGGMSREWILRTPSTPRIVEGDFTRAVRIARGE